MKLLFLSALLALTAINAARASESDRSFMLAMDYSSYLRMADNDTFGAAKNVLAENPYEKREAVPSEITAAGEQEKWNAVKDLKSKPHTLSGGGFIDTNDRVSVGAFAGYQFDEIDENKLNEAYSLTINVKVAL
ncbi:MAG: hypothetical protein IJ752_00635 [Alphaproteobacteria bacterium]|nr:hypothetical protein [Alphaproteobacteria bacterium]